MVGRALSIAVAVLLSVSAAEALDPAGLRVSRKETFAFAQPPAVQRDGDVVTIRFAATDFCDVAVEVCSPDGTRTYRHLAAGVLGANAPAPLQKNSLAQTLQWDGKDDLGQYVDQPVAVRVGLGLRPRFERTLFWSPHKRVSLGVPVMRARPEGVYVFDGGDGPQVRLFDHDGNYLRTIYPFPAGRLDQVAGLKWLELPPSGKFPAKWGLGQNTLLTAGDPSFGKGWPTAGGAGGVSQMVVGDKRLLLLGARLNRLGTDGSTGGAELSGPAVAEPTGMGADDGNGYRGESLCRPTAAALSPDGKTVYLAGYVFHWSRHGHAHVDWFHGVQKLAVDGDGPPEPFAGKMARNKAGRGGGPDQFNMPADVACDAGGRVYVADYNNDRVQVFDPQGRLVKTLKTFKPAQVRIDPASGAVWVFSWPRLEYYYYDQNWDWSRKAKSSLRIFDSIDAERPRVELPIPVRANFGLGAAAEVDFHGAGGPRVWLINDDVRGESWQSNRIRLFKLDASKPALVELRDFHKQAVEALARPRPPRHGRQRLYVNPADGKCYLGEHTVPTAVACKSFFELVEIDPATGRTRLVQMPMDAEDMGFDGRGLAYLRTKDGVARFDPKVWREVPFDYGEEDKGFGHGPGGGGNRGANVVSAYRFAGELGGMFHLGGFGVSPLGCSAVSACNPAADVKRTDAAKAVAGGRRYTPRMFPGRVRGWDVHLFDRHGQVLFDDAVPGVAMSDGLCLDRDNNVYIMAAAAPIFDGKPYVNDATCTLIKLRPQQGRILSTRSAIPLERARPDRPADLYKGDLGNAWIEGAQWAFGGVGLDGKSLDSASRNCSCFANGRPALDYFARVFAPEVDRYRVVVLDTAGNVICRIGRYGNVDDGQPLVDAGGPPSPRAIGGDEVALMHAMYLAVDKGHRLFVADIGNQRIVSVKLDYHASETVAVK